jgi:hypothetical protein
MNPIIWALLAWACCWPGDEGDPARQQQAGEFAVAVAASARGFCS